MGDHPFINKETEWYQHANFIKAEKKLNLEWDYIQKMFSWIFRCTLINPFAMDLNFNTLENYRSPQNSTKTIFELNT